MYKKCLFNKKNYRKKQLLKAMKTLEFEKKYELILTD